MCFPKDYLHWPSSSNGFEGAAPEKLNTRNLKIV